MAKYYRFHYSARYVGTDKTAIYKFPDDISEEKVKNEFDDWYESVDKGSGSFREISEQEAEECGIDEDCMEDY